RKLIVPIKLHIHLPVSCLLLAGLCAASAQQTAPTPPRRPASQFALVPAPPPSPVIHADRSVTFDLLMPHAEVVEVQVEGFAKPFPMVKDAANPGHWTFSLPPMAPEYYSYSFLVDGVNVVDPHNIVTKPSAFRVQSVFFIPGQPAEPWEVQDVPHGVLHHHEYNSAIVKRDSSYYVYTPPGFDPAAKTKYPVLYLRHGWAAWTEPALVQRNFTLFEEALYKEVMPRVTAEYPISASREEHAIAGLSMGGAETLLVGLNHTQDFAWIGAFSAGGIGANNFPKIFPAITPESGPAINKSLRLLWISVGTEDGLLEPNRKLIAWLKEDGVQPKAVETPGMHVWMVWRDNLANFAPLLFQPKK